MNAPKAPLFASAVAACALLGCAPEDTAEKIPITTSSEEAQRIYLEGRSLQDNARQSEARERYLQAIQLDDSFARAHLELASVAVTGKEFFDHLERAVSLADQVSRAEREMILAFDSAVKGRPSVQFDHLSKLVELYPEDERARSALGGWYFGRQQWKAAIDQYERATSLAPDYPPPYNLLGYSHRALGNWDQAEAAFLEYIERLPNEPNPYDSYAEMLMKQGRFEKSIETYRKALEIEPGFAPSYLGIGTNYVFLGKFEQARETYARLAGIARNEREKRDAMLWTAASFVYEGRTEAAIESLRERHDMAIALGDKANAAGDLGLIALVLLEAGRVDEAAAKFQEAGELAEAADLPAAARRAVKRQRLYAKSRVQLASGDVEGAAETAAAHRAMVDEKRIPSELAEAAELGARVAHVRGNPDAALELLADANRQNPVVLFLEAKVLQEKGEAASAREAFERVANYNGLDFSYAFVRGQATQLMAGGVPN